MEKQYYPSKTVQIEPEVHQQILDFTNKYKVNIGFLASRILEKELHLLSKDSSRLTKILSNE